MWAKFLFLVLAVLASLAVVAVPASAEWFGDLYLGGAVTQSKDINVTTTALGVPVDIKSEDVDFDTSGVGGGRFGYWLEAAPYLGLALDVFHFRPNVTRQTVTTTVSAGGASVPASVEFDDLDIHVTAISFDLMLRASLLKSQQFPKGQLQPYFSVGPAIFIAEGKDTTNFGPPNNQSDTDTSVGVKVGAGLAWQFHKNLAVFGEYRFTHSSPEFKFSPAPPFGKTTAETDINTHHFIAGISFRF